MREYRGESTKAQSFLPAPSSLCMKRKIMFTVSWEDGSFASLSVSGVGVSFTEPLALSLFQRSDALSESHAQKAYLRLTPSGAVSGSLSSGAVLQPNELRRYVQKAGITTCDDEHGTTSWRVTMPVAPAYMYASLTAVSGASTLSLTPNFVFSDGHSTAGMAHLVTSCVNPTPIVTRGVASSYVLSTTAEVPSPMFTRGVSYSSAFFQVTENTVKTNWGNYPALTATTVNTTHAMPGGSASILGFSCKTQGSLTVQHGGGPHTIQLIQDFFSEGDIDTLSLRDVGKYYSFPPAPSPTISFASTSGLTSFSCVGPSSPYYTSIYGGLFYDDASVKNPWDKFASPWFEKVAPAEASAFQTPTLHCTANVLAAHTETVPEYVAFRCALIPCTEVYKGHQHSMSTNGTEQVHTFHVTTATTNQQLFSFFHSHSYDTSIFSLDGAWDDKGGAHDILIPGSFHEQPFHIINSTTNHISIHCALSRDSSNYSATCGIPCGSLIGAKTNKAKSTVQSATFNFKAIASGFASVGQQPSYSVAFQHCFYGCALITMADGLQKPISEVQEGQWVFAFNAEGRAQVTATLVQAVHDAPFLVPTPHGPLPTSPWHRVSVDNKGSPLNRLEFATYLHFARGEIDGSERYHNIQVHDGSDVEVHGIRAESWDGKT